MALPKINSTPEYEVKIPSTGKTVKFRPFLVKEQKVLLIALESKDQKQVINSINSTIVSCVKDKIDLNSLTTYDTEYLFTQIRAKSVGEKTTVNINCKECNTPNEIEINFDDIKVAEGKSSEKIVKINDNYSIKLKYPTYQKLNSYTVHETATQTEQLIESVIACLDSLQSSDEIILFKDEPREEIQEFIDNLSASHLNEIIQFITNIPTLTYDVEFKCEHCSADNKITLKGLADFF